MKPNVIASLALLVLLGQTTPTALASDLPLTAENFEGASWNFNIGPTRFDLPLPASEGRSIFASTDFSWRQVRSRQQFTGPWILDAKVLPGLQSGGVNGDWGYLGFGTGWALYQGQWAGLVVHDGTAYAYEINRPGPTPDGIIVRESVLGPYQPNTLIGVSVQVVSNSVLRIQGPGFSGDLALSAPMPSYRIIAAVANSTDGFALGNLSMTENSRPDPLPLADYEFATWSFNQGPNAVEGPLPVQNGLTLLALDDFSWFQARSRTTSQRPRRITANLVPNLRSGGVNGDWCYVGFGTGWALYEGLWAGLVLAEGKAYAYEINRPNVDPVGITTQMIPIGDYRPGVPIEVTVDLLPGGHIRIQGPGIAGNLTLSVPAIKTRTMLAVANSIDGIELASIRTTELTAPIDPPVELEVYAGITVLGEVGGRYAIESKDSINQPGAWNLLTTLTLTSNRQVFIDVSSARVPSRVYRSRRLP